MGQEYRRAVLVLGSVPNLGPIILADDIEGLLKFAKSGTGADYTVDKLTTDAYNGSACLRLKTRVTDAAANDLVVATRACIQLPERTYRIDLLVKVLSNANTKSFSVQMDVDDGAYRKMLGVQWLSASGKWQYLNSVDAWADLVGGAQVLTANVWHRVSLLFRLDTNKYTSCICDNLKVDMSALSIYLGGTTGESFGTFWIDCYSVSTTPAEIYLDDVLVLGE